MSDSSTFPLKIFLVIDDKGHSCITLGLERLKAALVRWGDSENAQACCKTPPYLWPLVFVGTVDSCPAYSDGLSDDKFFLFSPDDIDELRREGVSFYRGGVIHA